MKMVFYSVVLNQHQAPVADALWELTNHQYTFVELINLGDTKGGTEDFSKRPYLLRAWESEENYQKAMELARTAECCVFSGVDALPFEKERMRLGLLSFDMGERWLKHGVKSLFSPRLLKWLTAYWLGGWNKKPLYKLCCSAFCAQDHYSLGTFKDKCYKWGYFTKVETSGCKTHVEASTDVSTSDITPLMWCSRYLMLKHPELPILMAERLKKNGYKFHLDMYGSGEVENQTKQLAEKLNVLDAVTFHGAVPNDQVHKAMSQSKIFLFTSDRYEGWGAVANESLSERCVLVASDAIGSSPYLIENGSNGFMFKAPKPSSSFEYPDMDALYPLYDRVSWLLDHPVELSKMQDTAEGMMRDIWSPKSAAISLVQLIESLKNGLFTPIEKGPCSRA